jgi:DNA-binding transcriptional LysR family regulator
VAVAEELHFGRAAARLHLAQPALSQQIHQVEQELGVSLFHRTTRHVGLTDAGKQLLRDATRILEEVEQAIEAARRAQGGELGRLVLGFVGSAASDVLPRVLRAYREQRPAVEVALREMDSAEGLAALAAGRIDAALLRPPVVDPALAHAVIRREPFVVALPQQHPLAAQPRIALADLAGEAFILFPRNWGSGVYDRVIAHCDQAGFSPRVVQEATEMSTIAGLVAAGIGISLVPASIALLRTAGVVYRTLDAGALTAEMAVAWRRDDTSAVLATFLEVARQAAGQIEPLVDLYPYQDTSQTTTMVQANDTQERPST